MHFDQISCQSDHTCAIVNRNLISSQLQLTSLSRVAIFDSRSATLDLLLDVGSSDCLDVERSERLGSDRVLPQTVRYIHTPERGVREYDRSVYER